MFSGGGFPGSFNSDVLNAQPTDDVSKDRLVEEIKSRAKGCLAVKNYPEAICLYSKAIEVLSSKANDEESNKNAVAILYSNRSLCQLGMGNGKEAQDDATNAIGFDKNYIKAYYRVAMAQVHLKQYQKARESLLKGLELKSDDKELRSQLEKVEVMIKNNKESESDVGRKPSQATTTTVASSKTTTNATSSSSTSTSNDNNSNEKEEDVQITSSDHVRGYKTTKDGKITTFFNREIDETTKQLIGDIAPKKIDSASEKVNAASNTNGSVWNSAGTYEEKILTNYAIDLFRQHLLQTKQELSGDKVNSTVKKLFAGGSDVVVQLEISQVNSLAGDAQITMIRNKKKYICDLNAEVQYRLRVTSGDMIVIVNGKCNINDITADNEFDLDNVCIEAYTKSDGEVKVSNTNAALSDSTVATLYRSHVSIDSSDCGLKRLIQSALDSFLAELKQKN